MQRQISDQTAFDQCSDLARIFSEMASRLQISGGVTYVFSAKLMDSRRAGHV